MTQLSVRRARAGVRPSRMLRYLPGTALVVDLVVVALVCVLAAAGRSWFGVFDASADASDSLALVAAVVTAGWLLLIWLFGGYRTDVFGAGTDEFKRVLHAGVLLAGLLGVGCFLAEYALSRGFYLLVFAVGIPALVLARLVLRRAVQRARSQGRLQLRVLIAGSPSHVDEIAAVLRRETWLGYRVTGALVPRSDLAPETASGIPVVGTCDEVSEVVRHSDTDLIFFAGGALTSPGQLRRIAWDLERADVQMVVAPSVTDVSGERIRVRPVGGLPLVHIDPPRTTDASRWAKRAFDVAGALLLLVAFSPLVAVAALRIRLHDGGPVLFRQARAGRDGREFDCLKLRTMVVDAEARLAALQDRQEAHEVLFKLKDDPRITAPGRWLRRYSIDELPQLVNVLRGDMSLVGPRPALPREVEAYDRDVLRRLRVRPGMTGMWQVSGRSDLSWDEAVRLDLYYVDNWSMLQDVNILTKTFRAVLGSRGAY